MSRPEPTRIVSQLPDAIPFVAPEEFERTIGRAFLARLGANESVFGASPFAVEAMSRAASATHNYGDPLAFELRSELAKQQGRTIEQYVVGPGIDGLFGHITRAYLGPGDAVVTTLGSYPTFNYFVHVVGASLIEVAYRDDGVDLEALVAAVRECNAKAVYVANPDNPSGTFHQPEAIQRFADQLPDSVLIILDEAYIDFVDPVLVDDPRIIQLRTFSKLYGMAGCRIAYATGDAELLQPLNRIRPHFEVNSIALAGALASLKDLSHVAKIKELNRQAKFDLGILLEKFHLYPRQTSTNFVLGDAGTKQRAEAYVSAMRQEGVFIRKPGAPPWDRYIRVTVGHDDDYKILAKALKQANL